MSSTCCAPPHISAESATVARAITRGNGALLWCISPSRAPAGTGRDPRGGGVVDADFRRQMRLEPIAEFSTKFRVLCAVGEIHCSFPLLVKNVQREECADDHIR